jgi:hypothetical protein
MARWRLKEKHYLAVEGTEWEYKETDQASGRQGRKIFKVPMHLDPEIPSDCNYPGEIIVSSRPHGKDYVFTGDPTPDMEPLDEEAEEISNSLRAKWRNPIEEINMNYSQSLLDRIEREISEVQRQQASALPAVDSKAFAQLQAQVADLMKANADLQAKLLEPEEEPKVNRRF